MLQPRQNKKVCFIAGAGHSGSTLLGLILGSHEETFYGGEIKKIQLDEEDELVKKFCRRCGPPCAIWGDLQDREEVDIYEQLSQRGGKPIIVDSAKNTDWIQEQLGRLRGTSSQPILVYLQRDGRAVLNSRRRKRPAMAIERLIANWMFQIDRTNALYTAFEGPKIKVQYEELALRSEEVIASVCEQIGIPYFPSMLRYYEHPHHAISGNMATHFLVNKAQQIDNELVKLSRKNRYHYDDHPFDIRLDLRWKRELSAEHEQLFETMAGPLNAEMRWEG